MTYFDEIKRTMEILAKDDRVIFIGQSIAYTGTSMYGTVEHVPKEKKIELPVFEDVQMGISTGLALEGYIPISIYPRMDFLVLAFNQLITHLDKIEQMSDGQFKPKVIIRTAIGSVKPLFPGPQHCQDYTEQLKIMLKNINVVKLEKSTDILFQYTKALESEKSTILIEIPDKYQDN